MQIFFSNRQLLVTKILEPYENEEYIVRKMIPTYNSPLKSERWIGTAPPKDPRDADLIVDEGEPFRFSGFGEQYVETPITVKRGQPIQFKAKYLANAKATITCLFDDEDTGANPRVKVDRGRNKAVSVTVDKTTRADTGTYTLVVQNEYGKDTCEIKAIVLDRPAPPTDLKVTDIFGN
jgi:hypothetical protein